MRGPRAHGPLEAFDLEGWYVERIAVLGPNGSGTSQFLSPLAHAGRVVDTEVPHRADIRFGARVVPGLFAQTHTRPDLYDRTPAEIDMTEHALVRDDATAALAR